MTTLPREFVGTAVPFPGGTYRAFGLRAVDGDTLDLLIDLGFSEYRTERVRLARVNTPELSSTDIHEASLARAAKAETVRLTEGRVLTIKSAKPNLALDPYGRWIAEVWVMVRGHELWLSDHLLAQGLAKPYP
jgi:micrococcal nuclease